MTQSRLKSISFGNHRFNHVHFVGVGGVGMSGIAEVLLNLGFTVSGSDQNESGATARLRKLGANISIGHDAAAVEQANVVVISAAIDEDNPELIRARERRIPVIPRAEMLGELMRFRRGVAVAGTHGKTTTTSLTASVLAEGGMDPTFVIGGVLNSTGSNARLGSGEYLVAEADESDGSFLLLQPVIAVVTNIDEDHMETYDGDPARLRAAFVEFLHHLPFYGVAIVCIDDPVLAEIAPQLGRSVVTYGFSEHADLRATEVMQSGRRMRFKVEGMGVRQAFELNLPGEHNVRNALAAIAVGHELGVDLKSIQKALTQFAGIGRRFNVYEQVNCEAGQCTVIDDYGHHPTELAATIAAARAGWPDARLLIGFQPHRYTRTRDLFDDFVQVLSAADGAVLCDVYPAGEEAIANADSRALCRALRARGVYEPIYVHTPTQIGEALATVVEDNDVILISGAGSIGSLAPQLAAEGIR